MRGTILFHKSPLLYDFLKVKIIVVDDPLDQDYRNKFFFFFKVDINNSHLIYFPLVGHLMKFCKDECVKLDVCI